MAGRTLLSTGTGVPRADVHPHHITPPCQGQRLARRQVNADGEEREANQPKGGSGS